MKRIKEEWNDWSGKFMELVQNVRQQLSRVCCCGWACWGYIRGGRSRPACHLLLLFLLLLLLPPPPPTSAHNFRCCAPPALSAAAWPRFESRLVFGLLHDGATPQCSSRNSHFRLVSPHLRLWDLLLRLVEAFWVILGKNVQHLAIGTSRKSIQLLAKLNWHPLVQQIVTSCCGLPIRSIFNIFCRGLQVWCISVFLGI